MFDEAFNILYQGFGILVDKDRFQFKGLVGVFCVTGLDHGWESLELLTHLFYQAETCLIVHFTLSLVLDVGDQAKQRLNEEIQKVWEDIICGT